MDRNKLLAMTPHQRAAYDRARVVPDDTFLQEPSLQGPQPMPRNYLADLAREYGMPSISDRLNSPTSGVGMLVDAVGGLGNALVVQPAQSFNRLLQNGYEPGNPQTAEDAFNVAGAAMVGGLAAPKPSNTVGIFGGRLAKTADHAKLAQAERMAAEGAPREQIWNQTGWFQGPDKKWRFEIDDSKSVVYPGYLEQTGKSEHAAPFRDRMSHSGYTSAYPEASNINIQRISGQQFPDRKGAGQYRDNHMWFDAAQPDRGRSIALHELQHDAQGREGFARGGSPKQFSADDIAAERQRSLSIGQPLDDWSSISPAAGDWSDNIVRRNLYNRLSGEVEARAVQSRRDLTPEERAARPPWLDYDVPESQQIVMFSNEGTSQSIGMSGRPEGATSGIRSLDQLTRSDPHPGPVIGYHGTTASFDTFDPAKMQDPLGPFFGTSSMAEKFAQPNYARPSQGDQRVIPARISSNNALDIAEDPSVIGTGRDTYIQPRDLVSSLEGAGLRPLDDPAVKQAFERTSVNGDFKSFRDRMGAERFGMEETSHHTADRIRFDALKDFMSRNGYDSIRRWNEAGNGWEYAPVVRGIVQSPETGATLYSGGGRPGAAVGAATNAEPQDKRELKSILDKYGLGQLLQPTDWARKMQPGDA